MIANAYLYPPGSGAISIYKWDADSNTYNSVYNYSTVANRWKPATNGKWFGHFLHKSNRIRMMQLDATNQAANESFIQLGTFYSFYKILSDDSLILPSDQGILTLVFNGTDWEQADVLEISTINIGGNVPSFDVTDTLMLAWNSSSSFNIYERTGLQWNLLQSHDIGTTYSLGSISSICTFLVDQDTVVVVSPYTADPRLGVAAGNGYLLFISKVNGVWQDQIVLGDDLGLSQNSDVGTIYFTIDSNYVLIGAPNEGGPPVVKRSLHAADGNFNEISKKSVQGGETGSFGSAFLFQRNLETKSWSAKAKIVVSKDINNYFGTGFGKNSHGDIMVMSCEMDPSYVSFYHCLPYSFPRCSLDPVNVTCNDLTLNDCSSVDFNQLDLYTQNDVQCGAVDASYKGVSIENYKFQVSLSLSRTLAPSTYLCNATASCPLPPGAASTPGANVPVASPTKKVSEAVKNWTAVGVVAALAGALLM